MPPVRPKAFDLIPQHRHPVRFVRPIIQNHSLKVYGHGAKRAAHTQEAPKDEKGSTRHMPAGSGLPERAARADPNEGASKELSPLVVDKQQQGGVLAAWSRRTKSVPEERVWFAVRAACVVASAWEAVSWTPSVVDD